MSHRYPQKPDPGMTRDDYALTLEEISQEIVVIRERVRQLEANGLRKARAILEKHGFTLQDLLPDGERHD